MNGLAWRQLRRAWRAGELRVLWLALTLAVAAITSVGFFTDRVQRAMGQQAGELLAADLVVAMGREVPGDWLSHATGVGLTAARSMEFPSMVQMGGKLQLAEVKAVDGAYPLRGRLLLLSSPGEGTHPQRGGPGAGQAWVDDALSRSIGLTLGSRVEIGTKSLQLAGLIVDEPDRSSAWFSIAPRVLMNWQDVASSGLISKGSRVSYRLLLAGETGQLQQFRRWVKPRLQAGDRVLGPQDVRQEIAQALTRATQFLELAALTSILLAGVAIAMAAMRYSQRQMDNVALMRCLGASRATVMWIYLVQLGALWLGGSLLGVLVGAIAQQGLALVLGQLFSAPLPAPGWQPIAYGFGVAWLTLAGFALPALIRLPEVPPLRVLRHEVMPPRLSASLLAGAALGALGLLTLSIVTEIKLAVVVLASVLGAVVVLLVMAWVMIRSLRPLRARVGVAWRFGLANIVRRSRLSMLQIASFGLGLMVLLLLSVVRVDLLEAWRSSIPPDAPNHFLINVQPDQAQGLQAYIHDRLGQTPRLYPMVRARLVKINQRQVQPADFTSPRAQRLLQREFNLTWAREMLPHNKIVAGRWWSVKSQVDGQFSVEQDLAQTLGIRLGDTLTYLVEGRPLTGRVSSLRTVSWDSFQPNFFVISTPALLQDAPASYITSFYLPAGQQVVLRELTQRYPNITAIDVDALMRKVRMIIDRVTQAVEAVFLFTLLAGLLVMYAAIEATQDERRHESALLRALGASSAQLRWGLLSEFALLGGLAGAMAALMAGLAGYGLATEVFEFSYYLSPWLLPVGIISGAMGVAILGYLGTRRALRTPPQVILAG